MFFPTLDSPVAAALHRKIASRSARTCVVGLGYAGLPLAVEIGRAAFDVTGVDTDPHKRATINAGLSDIPDVPNCAVADLLAAGRLRIIADLGYVDCPDIVTICVPTPLDSAGEPDLSCVTAAARALKAQLRPGVLVILESTTYPGTTEELLLGILEETGMTAGKDFFLAFSPERIDPGSAKWTAKNTPRVLGGLTPDCTALATSFFRTFVDEVVPVSSPRAAEMVKLLENTFRAVNIALVNEVALACEQIGVDVWEVIDAAATKPFGFMPFYPGPGSGGHCIPIDPCYLSWKGRQEGFDSKLADVAAEINAMMPARVVSKVSEALAREGQCIAGAKILLLGAAYKPGVGDVRESPALAVMALLLSSGAGVSYHDPHVARIDAGELPNGMHLESVTWSRDRLAAADCVIVLTDHPDFDYAELVAAARLIVDTRNAISVSASNVVTLGSPFPRTTRDCTATTFPEVFDK